MPSSYPFFSRIFSNDPPFLLPLNKIHESIQATSLHSSLLRAAEGEHGTEVSSACISKINHYRSMSEPAYMYLCDRPSTDCSKSSRHFLSSRPSTTRHGRVSSRTGSPSSRKALSFNFHAHAKSPTSNFFRWNGERGSEGGIRLRSFS